MSRLFPAAHMSLFALGLTVSALGASAEMMEVVGIADGDTLNVRQGPNASSADIGDLEEHTMVEVLGRNFAQTWAQIQYGDQLGWVSTAYLASSTPPPAVIGANVVTGIAADDPDGGLVVRGGAGTEFAAIGALRNETLVHVIQMAEGGTWAMIGFGGNVGWVSTAYLTAANTLPAPSDGVDPNIAPDGGPLPAVFTVTGVAADDMLWVRDAPSVTGARLGGLTPNSVVSLNARASEDWGQITLNGQIGYVHMGYLTRAAESGGTTTVNGFPLGLTCRGTEPFWTLTIAQDRSVEYTSLINGADPITSLTQTTPAIGGGYPYTFGAQRYSGTLDQTSCSDGMSDITYSMSLILNRAISGGQTETLYGCCNVN
ncbi:SH3 domain-containing protein [Celeribacter halophilus]|uniref:Uncharacterized conserved protein YgiM, contains N-terminal SH3 domain, DUF1202 family n=1 Tax=Celeribacter halophilus TaxID=576117 RepID=A0A1I3MSR8_9RHOB|nr:SH3 domain-containing protein [Celeribacter halophilus]PZX15495.1 uncharacterized protein YgiM (DUF1202 family) [Celeribacter halophilus]SFI99775.1 Uncharacterized conserved protein YgiM, contains N-terminal SH3 domain, DUF1202 family [Celeribacter halophilus]